MADADSTELTFDYPALPDRVWEALTNPAKLSAWLADSDLVPVAGHRFRLGAKGFAGLPEPVLGEVVEAEPPRRLVMRWRSGNSRATVAWLVEPARGGSRLRVVQSGVLGHPMRSAELAHNYQILFGERLRLFLRSGLLARLRVRAEPEPGAMARTGAPAGLWLLPDARPPSSPPPPAAGVGALYPPGTPEAGLSGETPVVFPIMGLPLAPVPRRPAWRVLVGWPLGLLVALLLVLAGFGLVIRPALDRGTDQAAPTIGATTEAAGPVPGGTANPGAASHPVQSTVAGPGATGGPGGPGGPGPTGAAAGPTAADPPLEPLTVTYRVTGQGPLQYSVAVSVTNPAGSAQAWHSVALRLSGVSLKVQPGVAWVNYRAAPPDWCFVPAAARASVGPGTTVTFAVTVSAVLGGVLGDVDRATLDAPACA